jgi:hypothetical protein
MLYGSTVGYTNTAGITSVTPVGASTSFNVSDLIQNNNGKGK